MKKEFNHIEYKKKFYPIGEELNNYLKKYDRSAILPISYKDLLNYDQTIPLTVDDQETLWNSVIYRPSELIELSNKLILLYQMINGNDVRIDHLFVGSIDFCTYGNSKPFRVKIINEINDNHDYIYIKASDSSRVYGLELEEIFSPNKMNYLIELIAF